MLVYLLFALMMAYVSAQHTPYTPCTGLPTDPINYFYITGCNTSPCHIKAGKNMHTRIIFTSPFDSPTAPMKLVATFNGNVESGDIGDMCPYMTPKCPIKRGTQYTLEYELKADLPTGCGTIKSWLETPQGLKIYCQTVNVCIDP